MMGPSPWIKTQAAGCGLGNRGPWIETAIEWLAARPCLASPRALQKGGRGPGSSLSAIEWLTASVERLELQIGHVGICPSYFI